MVEVLALMDHESPSPDVRYMDALSNFQDMGREDVVDMHTLGIELMATFGALGVAGAQHLNTYMEERLLTPLGLMFTGLSEPSVQLNRGSNCC